MRRIFRLFRTRYPSLDAEVGFRYAVKALNDTMGPEGHIPSMLVFGTLPTFPGVRSNVRDLDARMDVILTTRAEVEVITAELRVKTALKARLPPSTRFDLRPGQRVRVYRERSKMWEGPFVVSRTFGKQAWVSDGAKTSQFRCTQVLPDPAYTADREMETLLKGFQSLNSGGILVCW